MAERPGGQSDGQPGVEPPDGPVSDEYRTYEYDEEPEYVDENEHPRRSVATMLAIGLLAVVLVLAFAWNASALLTRDERPAAVAGQSADVKPRGLLDVLGLEASKPSKSAAPGSANAVGPSVAEACAQVVAARGAALQTAKPAMDQWAVHIGAMNKLVVGAITLAQANAFWAQTRLAASQNIHAFRTADDRARSMTVRCPLPRLVDDAAASPCARTAAGQHKALKAARAAIRTWKGHVHDMEMLRMGHLSAAMATKMWLGSWHRGAHQLRAYQRASQQIPDGGCQVSAPR